MLEAAIAGFEVQPRDREIVGRKHGGDQEGGDKDPESGELAPDQDPEDESIGFLFVGRAGRHRVFHAASPHPLPKRNRRKARPALCSRSKTGPADPLCSDENGDHHV